MVGMNCLLHRPVPELGTFSTLRRARSGVEWPMVPSPVGDFGSASALGYPWRAPKGVDGL
jgi:hypothetical protein